MVLDFALRAHSAWSRFRQRLSPEGGAVATEYALLLILIALAIILSASALGKALSTKYTSACNSLSGSGC